MYLLISSHLMPAASLTIISGTRMCVPGLPNWSPSSPSPTRLSGCINTAVLVAGPSSSPLPWNVLRSVGLRWAVLVARLLMWPGLPLRLLWIIAMVRDIDWRGSPVHVGSAPSKKWLTRSFQRLAAFAFAVPRSFPATLTRLGGILVRPPKPCLFLPASLSAC